MKRWRAFFRLSFVVLVCVARSGRATQTAPSIVLRCVNSGECNISGNLTLQVPGQAPRQVPLLAGTAKIPANVKTFDLDLQAKGFWFPRQQVVMSGNAVELPVWQTTPVRGRFTTQRSDELPAQFTLDFRSPEGTNGRRIREGTSTECAVAPDGSWRCDIPAVTLDLTIRAKTFIPKYAWDLKLKCGQTTDLGTIPLKHGASFLAWLDTRTVKSLKSPATARLMRMTIANSPELGERLNQPVAEGVFNARGVVQLGPIPAGTYTVEVASRGFATAVLDKVPIYENRESALRIPIALDPPITIRLSFQPPRDPSGAPWRISVHRADGQTFRRSNIAEGNATDGVFEIAGQGPGRYSVRVRDRYDNWYASRELDIGSQIDAQRTIEIPAVRLRGTVTAAKQPIAAYLIFGGRSGAERVNTVSDRDGKFDVTLPRRGRWQVDIESKELGILTSVVKNVEPHDDEVKIELADSEISGWVTDSDGRRVADAVVTLSTDAGIVNRRSDRDGTYRFGGVSPGLARITAANPRTLEQSRYLELAISDGQHRRDVQLVLENTRTLKGRVFARGEPVVGARVTAYGLGTGIARQQRAVSNLEGSFELSFPESATEIVLIVAAAGRTLQAFRIVPTDASVALDLASVGGTIRMRMAAGTSRPGLSYNGTPIPMPDLLDWARAHGSTWSAEVLEVPDVAPGLYRFCAARNGRDVCRDGTLAPNSILSLGAD